MHIPNVRVYTDTDTVFDITLGLGRAQSKDDYDDDENEDDINATLRLTVCYQNCFSMQSRPRACTLRAESMYIKNTHTQLFCALFVHVTQPASHNE